MLPSWSALYLHSKPFRRFKTVFVSRFDLHSGTRIDTHGDPVVGVSVLRSRTTGKWDHVFSVDKQKGLWQSPPPACMPSSSKFCNKEKASKFSYLLHFRQTINQDRVKVCSVVFFCSVALSSVYRVVPCVCAGALAVCYCWKTLGQRVKFSNNGSGCVETLPVGFILLR